MSECPIRMFFHCRDCLEELPFGTSPKEYSRTQTGVTEDGEVIVWCNRHEQIVAPITEQLRRSVENEECQCAKCTQEREDGKERIH